MEFLRYIHRNNVIQRDSKHSKYFVDIDGTIKIADFSFAKLVQQSFVAKTTMIGAFIFCHLK
jgi:serine/threonine protein kinase